MKPLIVDALASSRGNRKVTRDVIGAGPRTVAGVLENSRLKPKIASAEEVLKGVSELDAYDVLFVSGMTSDLMAVRRVVSKWKKSASNLALIGGPITSNPRDALIKAGGDLAVVGEGEQTLVELMDQGLLNGEIPYTESIHKVKGVSYRHKDEVLTSLRPVMKREDYDRFKPSTKVIRDYPLYFAARVYVETHRGCSNYLRAKINQPNGVCEGCNQCRGSLLNRYDCPRGLPPGCGYCSVPSLYGPPKSRSVENIYQEVKTLISEGAKRIVLSAPDFLDYGRDLLVEPFPLTDPRHPEPNTEALEELFLKLTSIGEFSSGEASLMIENVKGCLATEEVASLLGKYLPGTSVNVGFETGSEPHGNLLGRPSTPKENLQAIRRLMRAGLKPYVYFIHGLPGQTEQTVKDTIRTIKWSAGAGAERIILYRFQPLPMSAFSSYHSGPPAVRDRLSGMIQKAAKTANRDLKKRIVGHSLRVVIAGVYDRDPEQHIAYPMKHGPVVLVGGFKGCVGDIVDISIRGSASDRMVIGTLKDATF